MALTVTAAIGGALLPAAGATAPTMTPARTPSPLAGRSLRPAVLWGLVFGAIQAAAPLGFWWLDPATVYALSLTLIAAVYIGFAVADGRRPSSPPKPRSQESLSWSPRRA